VQFIVKKGGGNIQRPTVSRGSGTVDKGEERSNRAQPFRMLSSLRGRGRFLRRSLGGGLTFLWSNVGHFALRVLGSVTPSRLWDRLEISHFWIQ